MISIAKAIVNERAVMIELLNALFAKSAMEWTLRSNYRAVYTEVIQVDTRIESFGDEFLEIIVLFNKSWIFKGWD